MCVSEIRVKQIRVNQGLGVHVFMSKLIQKSWTGSICPAQPAAPLLLHENRWGAVHKIGFVTGSTLSLESLVSKTISEDSKELNCR